MTDQSPRDALARRIAIKMDATLASDDVWQANADMVANHLAEPNWGVWLPYRKAYAMADLVLAWLAEPEQIEAMHMAYDRELTVPAMKPCPRCEGRGYHHGFGETGHDPDWCEDCGGSGLVLADEQQAMRAAVAALRGKP